MSSENSNSANPNNENLHNVNLAALAAIPCTQYYIPWRICGHWWRDTWLRYCLKYQDTGSCSCLRRERVVEVSLDGDQGHVEKVEGKERWEGRCVKCRSAGIAMCGEGKGAGKGSEEANKSG
jgi:hypothetical protein